MRVVALEDETGRVVCARCAIADNPWTRLRGLLGRKSLDPDEGLLIRPTNSIHMLFMRFPIDAVFLDRELVVLRVVPGLPPWRMAMQRGAKAVVELPAGAAGRAGIREGARLSYD
ncbi:MAG TPA: DUF192 domain-containing protein [Gaiellaceae bacterium]